MSKAVKIISALTILFVLVASFILIRHLRKFPIHRAIEANDIAKVKSLLAKKPRLVNRVDNQRTGHTPLHLAASTRRIEIAELLLAKGAAVNLKGLGGKTALHPAATLGHEAMIRVLLRNGADINAAGRSSGTPLHCAARSRSADRTNAAQILLDAGADINAVSRGFTPLHLAAQQGLTKTMAILTERGADIEATTPDGRTPLHAAADNNRPKAVKLLIERGANINAATSDGSTPLHMAAFRNAKPLVELLIAKGADTNAKNKAGQTPLYIARASGRSDAVEALGKYE